MKDIKRTLLKGSMNKDVDERLIPSGQYTHAENILVSVGEGSDAGGGKSVNGNVKLTNLNLTNGKVIGKYTDDANSLIYAFITSDTKDLVIEFNAETNTPVVLLEYTNPSSLLNFREDKLITGVVKIIDGESGKDLLIWTDDLNPPRCINIERAKLYAVDGFDEEDISLIKPPPRTEPTTQFTYSQTGFENYIEDKFLSFAYRYKYLDGEKSVLSNFTEYQFAPNAFKINFPSMQNEGMQNKFNAIDITFNTGGKQVVGVDLVFKMSGNKTVYLIESFDKAEEGWGDDENQVFRFSNNKINKVLPEDTIFATFDNVPLKAKALAIIGNRIAFGNYVEGYDLVDESSNLISLDYSLSLKSNEITGDTIPTSIDGTILVTQNELTLDLTGVSLLSGNKLTFDFNLKEEAGGNYGSGYLRESYDFILNKDFADATELAEDTDFIYFIEQVLTNGFNNNRTDSPVVYIAPDDEAADITALLNLASITTDNVYRVLDASADTNAVTTEAFYKALVTSFAVPHDLATDFVLLTNEEARDYIPSIRSISEVLNFRIESYDANTIAIRSPRITFSNDYSPHEFGTILDYVWWEFETSTSVLLSEISVATSLKTNRSYEVGIVYSDKEGRTSTVLTKSNINALDDNTIKVDSENADKQNKIVVNVENKPPAWADRYRFAVKQSKGDYHNIFCNVIYQDGLFRWVKLDGESKDKVKEGDTLIVKSDFGGMLDELVKVKVLELKEQEKGFLLNNVDADGDEIEEEAGLYMKIKPFNFDVDAIGVRTVTEHLGSNHLRYVTRTKTQNLFGEINDSDVFEPFGLNVGDKVNIYIRFKARGNIAYTAEYDKEFTVNDNYISVQEWFDAEVGDLGTFGTTYTWDGETNLYNSGDYTDPVQPNHEGAGWGFLDKDNNLVNSNGAKFFVMAHKDGTASRKITTTVRFTIATTDSTLIFETEPDDIAEDIFYETGQTFDIVGGIHQGNTQNQIIGTQPAICELDFYNCFAMGNGVESYVYLDKFNAKKLNIDLRPNAVSEEGYKEQNRFADITYSEPYVESSNVNGLNTFNLSRGNFKDDLEKKYGTIQHLTSRDSNVVVFQEDKIGYVLFGKDVLYNADGSSNITSVDKVLGVYNGYAGEYGISKNPESIAQDGNNIFFTDSKRGCVLRLGLDGVSEISKYNMQDWFIDLFTDTIRQKKVGEYDPFLNMYTLASSADYIDIPKVMPDPAISKEYTLTFDDASQVKGWTSFWSYIPDMMVGMNNKFFSFKNGELYQHHIGNRNEFYGVVYDSKVIFIFNDAPSDDKIFKVMMLESNQSWNVLLESNLTNSSIKNSEFNLRESRWFAFTRRSENDDDLTYTSVCGIGNVTGAAGNDFTYGSIEDAVSIGDSLFKVDNGNKVLVGEITDINDNVITVAAPQTTLNIGEFCFVAKNSRVESSSLRGYYLKAELSNNESNHVELFAATIKAVKSYV